MPVDSPIPTLLLERLAAGELSEDERRALIERYACSEDELAARRDALLAQHDELLRTYPAAEFAKAVHNQLQTSTRTWPRPTWRGARWTLPATLAAAAAVAALVMSSPTTTPPRTGERLDPTQDVILLKGERPDALRIWRSAQPSNQRLDQGDQVRQGDTIQLEYFTPTHTSGMIFSVDGRGVITLHHPENTESTAALERGTHSLPYSYTLDDAPHYERFFMVQCSHDINVHVLLQHAEIFVERATPDARRDTFELPSHYDCTIHSMWLAKDTR